jgi:hypothetical protein
MPPWLMRLVAGISPQRPDFDPRLVQMRFVMDKVSLAQVYPGVLRFSQMFHNHSFTISVR